MTLKHLRQCTQRILLAAGVSASVYGCTYVNSVSQTNIPADRSKKVSASYSKFIFFGTSDSEDPYELVERLRQKCPNGSVRGILTKQMRRVYFLFIYSRITEATGYCIKQDRLAAEDHDLETGVTYPSRLTTDLTPADENL